MNEDSDSITHENHCPIASLTHKNRYSLTHALFVIGSGNGLAPIRWQAMTCIKVLQRQKAICLYATIRQNYKQATIGLRACL